MSGRLDRIYSRSPIWLQQVGINAFGLVWKSRRYGGNFKQAVGQFESRENYSAQQWLEYQTTQLRALLIHAETNVPYYHRVFGPRINSRTLQSFTHSDLASLPILNKEQVRHNSSQMLATNFARNSVHTYSTSGTTGTPLKISYTNSMHRTWSAAYETRCRRWAGVNYQMSRAMIGGRNIVSASRSLPPFWRYNYAERQLYLSAFHISPMNASAYVDALNEYQPQYLVGYASSHFALAKLILEQKLKVLSPRCVLTSSDKLSQDMRQTIEEAYGAPVYDGYSGVEACCLVSECEHHRLHISPDVGIIELLKENGSAAEPGEAGEIVATGLLNFAQPLIRYRTGDLASWSRESCSCGRQMPVVEEILGRSEDQIVLRDGRCSSSFYKVLQGLEGIREAQVVQQDYDHLVVSLVAGPGFSEAQRDRFLQNIADRYGPVRVDIRMVESIERAPSGKLRLVISKVSTNPK